MIHLMIHDLNQASESPTHFCPDYLAFLPLYNIFFSMLNLSKKSNRNYLPKQNMVKLPFNKKLDISKDYLKQENIAIGKDAYVNEIFNDSWQYDIEAYYLTDGKSETRWSSATQVHNPPETPVEAWLMLDMEQVCSLRRIIVRWNDIAVFAKDFTVLVSDDGVEFTKVMDVTTDTYIPVQMVNLPEHTAGRYVRLEFHVPSNIYGYSIQEVEVYGEATEEKGEELDVNEAEYALYTGSVILTPDENASGGTCVTNINYRDTCIFDDLPESHIMVVHYRCMLGGRLTVYIDNRYATDVALPATEGNGFGQLSIDMYIPEGSTTTTQHQNFLSANRDSAGV